MAKRMKIDQYCQRQRCKHVDRRIGAILACFRVARVCRRQLGFLVRSMVLTALSGMIIFVSFIVLL